MSPSAWIPRSVASIPHEALAHGAVSTIARPPRRRLRPMTDKDPLAGLVPERFDRHTIIFLIRPADAPTYSDEELDRLQIEHLTYLRGLKEEGVLIANGPLDDQTDVRMRGISIYVLPLEEALERANDDPMVHAGRFEIRGAQWLTAAGTISFGSPGDGV
jgi:uncharacterized protein YciI